MQWRGKWIAWEKKKTIILAPISSNNKRFIILLILLSYFYMYLIVYLNDKETEIERERQSKRDPPTIGWSACNNQPVSGWSQEHETVSESSTGIKTFPTHGPSSSASPEQPAGSYWGNWAGRTWMNMLKWNAGAISKKNRNYSLYRNDSLPDYCFNMKQHCVKYTKGIALFDSHCKNKIKSARIILLHFTEEEKSQNCERMCGPHG